MVNGSATSCTYFSETPSLARKLQRRSHRISLARSYQGVFLQLLPGHASFFAKAWSCGITAKKVLTTVFS
jgi:hypothetical protein